MPNDSLFLAVVVAFTLLTVIAWGAGVFWAKRFVDQIPPGRQNVVPIAWACMLPMIAILAIWVKFYITGASSGFSSTDASMLLIWLLICLMMLSGGLWSRLARWQREKREDR